MHILKIAMCDVIFRHKKLHANWQCSNIIMQYSVLQLLFFSLLTDVCLYWVVYYVVAQLIQNS
jgi:hypothetical protein